MSIDMNLRQWRSFVAVAEELHFGRAAARLQMQQPALSRQVKELERTLGVELFARTSRRVQLTQAGRALLADAPRILAQAERAVAVTRRTARGEAGALAVGMLPSVANRVLPAVVQAHRARYPDVKLAVMQFADHEQLANLLDWRIDLGFVRVWQEHDELEYEAIEEEPLCVVVPSGHALAAHREVTVEMLACESFVLWPRRPEYDAPYEGLLAACQRAGIQLRSDHESYSAQTTLGLVAAGLGVAFLTASYRVLRRADVALVPIAGQTTTLRMVWHRDNRSVLLEAFRQTVRDTMAAL